MDFPGLHLIDVRVAAEVEVSSSAMGSEVVVAGSSMAGVRMVISKSVARFGCQPLM